MHSPSAQRTLGPALARPDRDLFTVTSRVHASGAVTPAGPGPRAPGQRTNLLVSAAALATPVADSEAPGAAARFSELASWQGQINAGR